MRNIDGFSSLINGIYDAALDPSLWPDIIEQIAGVTGSVAGCLMTQDLVQKTGRVFYGFGDQPHYRQLYFDEYIRLDPIGCGLSSTAVGQVISNSDITPHTEFRETQFYQEWMQPQGWVDNVFAPLMRSPTSMTAFAIARGQRDGLADDAVRRHMRLIVPHVRRAVLIGKLIELKTAQAATFADTLDGIGAGMFLVSASGSVVHVNAAAQAMLRQSDFLRVENGRLIVKDAQINRTLMGIFTAAGSGDAAVGIKGIAIPLATQDGKHYVAHVLPLTSGARRDAGSALAAAAALFVREAVLQTPSSPQAIAKIYKLTATELRVLLAIVEVGGAPEAAEMLGISNSTVRTHLGKLFGKTGVRRQADLVRLVAGFSNPLLR